MYSFILLLLILFLLVTQSDYQVNYMTLISSINSLLKGSDVSICVHDSSSVFFQYFGTGAGGLRIGKISDKTRNLGFFLIYSNIELDKREVCLRY